jgi:hypothetical protein
MSNDVSITLSAQDRNVDQTFLRMERHLDLLTKKLVDVSKASEAVNRQKFDAHVREMEKAAAAAEKLRAAQAKQAGQRSAFNRVASSERLAALRRTESAEAERQERFASAGSRFKQIAVAERLAAFNRNKPAARGFFGRMEDRLSGGLDDVRSVKNLATVSLAAQAAGFALDKVGDALHVVAERSRQLREEADKRMLDSDKQQRELQTQMGGETPEARKAARKRILDIAERNAATPAAVNAITKELAGSGFVDPLASGTTEFGVQLAQSANLPPEEAVQTMQSLGRFLVGFGKEKTNLNVQDLGLRLRGLYKDTTVQVRNAEAWAEAATTLNQFDIPLETSLSALGIATTKEEAAVAATGVRNVVTRMGTFSESDKKTGVLKRMGLEPADVDLVGETLPEALAKLKAAMESLPKEERMGAAKVLFEEQGLGTFFTLADAGASGEFEKFAAMQRDRKGFEEGVRLAQSGPNAADVRRDVRDEKANFAREDKVALDRETIAVRAEAVKRQMERNRAQGGVGALAENALFAIGEKVARTAFDLGVLDPQSVLPEAADVAKRNLAGRTRFSLDKSEQDMRAANRQADIVTRGEALKTEIAKGGDPGRVAQLEAELNALKAVLHGNPAQRKAGEGYLKQIADQTAPRPAPAAHVPVAAAARSRT